MLPQLPSLHLTCVLVLVVTVLAFMSPARHQLLKNTLFTVFVCLVAMRIVPVNCDSLGVICSTPSWRSALCLALIVRFLGTVCKRAIFVELRWPFQLSRLLCFMEMFSRSVLWASKAPQCAIREPRCRAIVKKY